MNPRRQLALLALLALGLVCLTGPSPAADDKETKDAHAMHAAFDQCAKACTHCMRECESCAHHCAELVASGQKDHLHTLGTCADCAEFCTAAAKIVSHRGPMAALICGVCARACDSCGEACRKFPSDHHMQTCAKACQECAQACRAMLKHTGGAAEEK